MNHRSAILFGIDNFSGVACLTIAMALVISSRSDNIVNMNTNYHFTNVPISIKRALTDGTLSLSQNGRIGLGRQFVEQYGITSKSRAHLYWDSANTALAFWFDSDEGYTVAFVNGAAGYILANSFFKTIGIDPSQHHGYYQYDVLSADEAGIAGARGKVFVVRLASDGNA